MHIALIGFLFWASQAHIERIYTPFSDVDSCTTALENFSTAAQRGELFCQLLDEKGNIIDTYASEMWDNTTQ